MLLYVRSTIDVTAYVMFATYQALIGFLQGTVKQVQYIIRIQVFCGEINRAFVHANI